MSPPTLDSKAFYNWMAGVVDFGCDYRRNQRPTHPGVMSQVGVTLGARHIPASQRQLGYGVSYYHKLSDEVKATHNEDVVAASGIFWSMAISTMPTEVTAPMIKNLSECGIPHMATRCYMYADRSKSAIPRSNSRVCGV
ncbi:hypothetical protein F5890DRAFT_1468398 [Lentinula detonsa]|uniref:Uncharacterized protein n=1 Tax=Lentinula detonsa TaxID=2804962 RepID=A0AA38PR65_9AGAR|nr:hypothetical protein F5890DRAFT_1468398 [Lentinula detonsa]